MDSTKPSLIDFYRLKRAQQGEPCVLRPHHYRIASTLERLVLGQLPRPNLMILMPPRCSKTTLGGETFVEWATSWFPDSEWLYTSYGSELATASTMRIRDTLASDWYRSLVGSDWGARVPLVGEKAGGRQDHFRTLEGGAVKGVGIGGGITGFGAGKLREEFGGAIVVDDALKAQDARSPAIRAAAYEFIKGTLKSRRNRIADTNPTPIVLIMQRLHPEDPAGMLLREERDQWNVLQIPAHQDDGTSIWEDRISAASLELMLETDATTYWAQYQQAPNKTARTTYKEDWWRYWRDREAVERRLTLKIITADTAFKPKDSSDYSVLQCWGFEGISGAYLLDQDRGQWDFPDLMRHSRAFLAKHTSEVPHGWLQATKAYVEDKASGTSLVQTLRREGMPFTEWLPDDKTAPDKVSRAKQTAIPVFAGRVHLPHPTLEGYRWVNGWVNEHSAFSDDDSHLHDDQVDTQTCALLIWLQKGGGRGPVPVWPTEERIAA